MWREIMIVRHPGLQPERSEERQDRDPFRNVSFRHIDGIDPGLPILAPLVSETGMTRGMAMLSR
jgi:hypothetical protein